MDVDPTTLPSQTTMQLLHPGIGAADFFERLARASQRVLLLDYDGTLAPFHRRPERATPYPQVAALLKRAMSRGTRVVIVSGRRLADLRGPLAWVPHDEAWASHGWERFSAAGERTAYAPANATQRHLQLAEAGVRDLAMHGARIERKVASVAVHWRGLQATAIDRIGAAVDAAWSPLARADLDRLDFDGGVELRARGRDKGHAVRDILDGCSAQAACAYLGDDLTDEDAFAAMHGRGLGVLVRPELRETCADMWIRPPSELVGFLERWCACGAAA
jgi:trehalose 6-phosphate phosphatase